MGLVDLAASVLLRLFAALLSKGGPDHIFSLPAPRRKSQHGPASHHFNTSFDSSQRAGSRREPSAISSLHFIWPLETFMTEVTTYPICACGIRYRWSLPARESITSSGILRARNYSNVSSNSCTITLKFTLFTIRGCINQSRISIQTSPQLSAAVICVLVNIHKIAFLCEYLRLKEANHMLLSTMPILVDLNVLSHEDGKSREL